jgi:hypothetical protein
MATLANVRTHLWKRKDVVTMTCEWIVCIGCGRRKNIHWNQTSFWNRYKKNITNDIHCVLLLCICYHGHVVMDGFSIGSMDWVHTQSPNLLVMDGFSIGSMDWVHTQSPNLLVMDGFSIGSMDWVHKQWWKHLLWKDGGNSSTNHSSSTIFVIALWKYSLVFTYVLTIYIASKTYIQATKHLTLLIYLTIGFRASLAAAVLLSYVVGGPLQKFLTSKF